MLLRNDSYANTLKTYIPLLVPIFINFLGYGLLHMVDVVVLRDLGDKDALTASELGKKICFTPLYFLTGFTNALSVVTIQSTVNNDYKRSTEALKSTLLVSILFSGVCSCFLFFFPATTIHKTKQSTAVIHLTLSYLPILSISLIPWALSMSVRRYLRGLAWVKSAMVINLLGSILNIVMSYFLVHGSYYFPKLGLYGLPWAVVISRLFTCALSLFFLHVAYKEKRLLRVNFFTLDMGVFKRIMLLGFPLGVELAGSYAYDGVVKQTLTGSLGEETNRVATLVGVIEHLFKNCCVPVSVVASVMIGKAWKEKDKKAQHFVKEIGYMLAAGIGVSVVVLFYTFFDRLLNIAKPDAIQDKATMKLATNIVWCSLPTLYLYGLKLLSIGLLSGLSSGIAACAITLGSYFFVGLPISYSLSIYFGWGIQGVFMGTNIAYLFIIILSNHYFHKRWKKAIKT